MIELYHHGSSVCAAKVRFALGRKGPRVAGPLFDILKGDQFDAQYVKLNPKAVVPTLIHDGQVLVESTVIIEYLDEYFPIPRSNPRNPRARGNAIVDQGGRRGYSSGLCGGHVLGLPPQHHRAAAAEKNTTPSSIRRRRSR